MREFPDFVKAFSKNKGLAPIARPWRNFDEKLSKWGVDFKKFLTEDRGGAIYELFFPPSVMGLERFQKFSEKKEGKLQIQGIEPGRRVHERLRSGS